MVDSDDLPFFGQSLDESESYLLELISNCSGRVEGRTKLMKLVFFSEYYDTENDSLQDEEQMGLFDDFIIYNHGPFSRDLMNVFDSLKEEGLVEEETELTFKGNRRKVIHLTEDGEKKVDSGNNRVSSITDDFGNMSASKLEELSLNFLDISREEKEQYRYTHVSEIIE